MCGWFKWLWRRFGEKTILVGESSIELPDIGIDYENGDWEVANVYSTIKSNDQKDIILTKGQKKLFDRINIDPVTFWKRFWKVKGIPNPTNMLFRFFHNALPGVFSPLNNEVLFFELEGSVKIGNICYELWNFTKKLCLGAKQFVEWNYSCVMDGSKFVGVYLHWLSITFHLIWKHHCEFVHGGDIWGAGKIVELYYREWEGMGDAILKKNKNVDMEMFCGRTDFNVVEVRGMRCFRRETS